MALNFIKIKIKNIPSKVNNNSKNIINSRLSDGEIVSHKPLSNLFNKDQKFRFNYITIYKPRLTPIKGIKAEEKRIFIRDINNFKKTFHKIINKHKIFAKREKRPFEELNYFYRNYNIFKDRTKDFFGEEEMLKELKKKFEEHNIEVPSIEGDNKNLFKKNLLLSKSKNINDFLNHHLGTNKSDSKSIKYINKMNKIISNKIIGGSNISMSEVNKEIDKKLAWTKKYFGKSESKEDITFKTPKLKENNITININETLKTLKDLDIFLEYDTKYYLDLLKNNGSRINEIQKNLRKSQNNFNRSIYSFHNKTNKSINSEVDLDKNDTKKIMNKTIKLNVKNKDNNLMNDFRRSDKNIIKNHNSSKIINNSINNNIQDSISINDYDNNIDMLLKRDRNKSTHIKIRKNSIKINNIPKGRKSTNFIKIKKFYFGRNQISQESEKSHDLANITMSTLQQNSSYDKIFNSKNNRERTPKFKELSFSSNKNNLTTEKIYETLKNKDDPFEYNDLIKKYYRHKNIKSHKFTIDDIVDNYQNMSNIVIKNDFLKKNINLKKRGSIGLESLDKLNDYFYRTNIKIEDMKNEINQIFLDISKNGISSYKAV